MSRVLVWGINYSPEVTGIAPYNTLLCESLASRGHRVEMVTTFPYYPAWKKRPEDRGKWFRAETKGGVVVHRCWHYVPRRVTAWRRICHEASFVFTSFLRMLFLSPPDVFVVISPPLLLGSAAWLIGLLKRAPFLFHVQDLQPDAAMALAMLEKGVLVRGLYRLEGIAYDKAVAVSAISREMIEAIRGKGVPMSKLHYFPNSVFLPGPAEIPARGRFRSRQGLADDLFLATYSGNVGLKQGLGILVETARYLVGERIMMIICGEGAERENLARTVAEAHLTNVRLLPLQDDVGYRELLVDADLCLITQQAGSGRFFLPSKLLHILAYSRPVLAVADVESDLSKAMNEGGFGVRVEPGHPEHLAETLIGLSRDRARCAAMGQAGNRYVRRFDAEKVLSEFADLLERLTESREQRRANTAGDVPS